MPEHKIFLNGHLDVPADRWQNVMDALPKHIELTLQEPGCISFEVKPSKDIKHRLLVSEIFKNKEAFDHHNARAKASSWFEVTENIPRSYKVSEGEPNE